MPREKLSFGNPFQHSGVVSGEARVLPAEGDSHTHTHKLTHTLTHSHTHTHTQVKRVFYRLKEIGVAAWFDEESMTGDINLTVG